jgi:methionyl-tRNA formyltransferase
MKIVFFGTSPFAARVLSYLLSQKVGIVAVVTRVDKPKGRSLNLLPPPVKEYVLKDAPSIPILQPLKASTPEFADSLKSYVADFFVVVAYGEILKPMILSIPKKACLNTHASLLPKYRGAAPIQRAIMNGETETGIAIMEMVPEMDAGDVYAMAKTPISNSLTFGELDQALSDLAGPLLLQVLQSISQGKATKTPQNHALATFSPKLTAAEEVIDWTRPAAQIHNQIRALSPFPGAWCWVEIQGQKKRLKIKRADIAMHPGKPCQNIILNQREWVVACGVGSLSILEAQLEGKKNLPIDQFLRGNHILNILV